MAEANAAGSTTLPALSPAGDAISSTSPPTLDRAALMRRAHLIARRFIGILPNYRACLARGLRCAWADAKARQEHRERFQSFVPITPSERAVSERATRRCGASYMPF
jgi:hypothetical protein